MASFDALDIAQELKTTLTKMNFIEPTPIQAAAIPVALQGRDIIGSAQTGTGKTAAFLLPTITQLMAEPTRRVLILAPTRELAVQIDEVLQDLGQGIQDIRGCVLIGGASFRRQYSDLQRNPTFVIATPGRLWDHVEQGTIDLSVVTTIILDEVDRMFDMGFLPQVQKILDSLSETRQTLLFSATMSKQVRSLALKYTKNAESISVGVVNTPLEKIKQSKIEVDGTLKNSTVLKLVQERSGPVLIFARTRIRADRLSRFLKKEGAKATAIHGDRTQSQRLEAIRGFQSGYYQALVATDVASRGLDISNIQSVVNYDLPESREDYIHRIGRTARGGAEGEAISLVTPGEDFHWRQISRSKEDLKSEGSQRPGQRRDQRGAGAPGKKPGRFSRFFKKADSSKRVAYGR
jgi:ATP-dependent RNA helicase RhlE